MMDRIVIPNYALDIMLHVKKHRTFNQQICSAIHEAESHFAHRCNGADEDFMGYHAAAVRLSCWIGWQLGISNTVTAYLRMNYLPCSDFVSDLAREAWVDKIIYDMQHLEKNHEK